MWSWTCVVILCAVAASEAARDEWWQVQIAQGPVRGQRDSSGYFHSFYNIPYATGPTNRDKFKPPLPPPTWTEPYDAIDKGIICPQFDLRPLMPDNLKTQQDCLVVNVHVPDTQVKNLPVFVYVHGGGFQLGYGEWLKSKNLLKDRDIVVVTFNYRLGIRGFLCLGTEDAPGNAGMKDQVALLRWVQQNIAAFGGNPNDVTIIGSSAGSASVDLLMLSKSAKGLFHKVVPESGASIAAFAVLSDPLQKAKEHAKKLNFTNVEDVYALEEFYKTLSDDLLTADSFMDIADSSSVFVPCVERDTEGEEFLTEPPINILKRGDYEKVPLLYGFANMEGLLRLNFFETWKVRFNEKFSDFIPGDLYFETEDEKEKVAKQVKEFYFGDKPVDSDSILRYVDFFSDVIIRYPMMRAAKLHLKAGHDQVYLYEYSFVDDDTPVIPHTENLRGADHCAQTLAVFDGKNLTVVSEDDISKEYKVMKKTIREMWRNFVKTGKPVPEGSSLPVWPAVGADMSPHMSLGQKVELRGVLLEERTRFWDNIYQQYYREPIPPPTPPPRRTEL
ncbi:para-nitrobenzyl esterase-like [Anticarsia gemmatalis]|uniref:para-nitrobenzyl esterase-like n=1 Tax=Anticarsia gemmatalis TaxID=129554 RepID=UPI003F75E584